MKKARNGPNEVNAGSMADIAFLLLIFFLVTTMVPEKNEGIMRRLPPDCLQPPCGEIINERNILRIQVDSEGNLLVEDGLLQLEEIKTTAMAFIDNNFQGNCNYCNGKKKDNLSDNPKEAIISVTNDREASYGNYISLQNELVAAYYELRRNFSERTFKKKLSHLSIAELKAVKDAYPMIISEAEVR